MTTSQQRRKAWIIALGIGSLILFLALAGLNAFNWKFLNPSTIGGIVAFTALSALAFLLFLILLLLLGRNLLKLYADERSHVIGSRLRTRMLIGATLVSLVPLSFMFVFSYGLMNRAVDRWFTQPVTQMRDDSNAMARSLSEYTSNNAHVEAMSIASGMPALSPAREDNELSNRSAVQWILRRHRITLQGGFAVIYRDGRAVAALNMPQTAGPAASVKPWLPEPTRGIGSDEDAEAEQPTPSETLDPADPAEGAVLAAAGRGDRPVFTFGHTDFALGVAANSHPGSGGGKVVVGLPLPTGISETMVRLRAEADDFYVLQRQRRAIRTTYMILLLMMTALALFVSTWLALHLSKQVTRPVEDLADAMAAIAAGHYGHRVEERTTDELGDLIRSFNDMAEDLQGSRAQVEASNGLLSTANTALSARSKELEARRSELETMLETIPNGVATIDAEGRILLANRALSEMLDPGGQKPFIGNTMQEVFPPEMMEALDRLVRRSHRMGSASGEMEMTATDDGTLNLLATVALLESGTAAAGPAGAREHLGYVLVLENATELLRAQKQSAWKEVARRVAHEIKNPLTPISLSAEQIGRHIERLDAALGSAELASPSVSVIRRCSQVISTSVESMRGLVDQFAALAQFPTAQPRPADLNTIVENSLALFAGRTDTLRVVRRLAPNLPLVLADSEAMKRALGNLIDNAVEAMQHALLRELRLSTCLLESGLIELIVSDTGAGLTDEMRERLFLPYFSTKQRGTGLGLAIAAKIIQEHGGSIRAEKNEPAGARFILELRPAARNEVAPMEQVLETAG